MESLTPVPSPQGEGCLRNEDGVRELTIFYNHIAIRIVIVGGT